MLKIYKTQHGIKNISFYSIILVVALMFIGAIPKISYSKEINNAALAQIKKVLNIDVNDDTLRYVLNKTIGPETEITLGEQILAFLDQIEFGMQLKSGDYLYKHQNYYNKVLDENLNLYDIYKGMGTDAIYALITHYFEKYVDTSALGLLGTTADILNTTMQIFEIVKVFAFGIQDELNQYLALYLDDRQRGISDNDAWNSVQPIPLNDSQIEKTHSYFRNSWEAYKLADNAYDIKNGLRDTILSLLHSRAIITANSKSGKVPLTVNFDASGSKAGEGMSIQSYTWNFGDGNSDTGITTSHTYTLPGNYTVTLTVADSSFSTDSATEDIYVDSPVHASFSMDASRGKPPFTIHFDATGSYEENGEITNYLWDFGDGNSTSGEDKQAVAHEYTTDGYWVVTLTVTGKSGYSSTSKKYVTVGSSGATYITSGTIDFDTTWDTYGSPYILNGNITVNAGVALTISPGVIVKLNQSNLTINGTLIADGNDNQEIVFTSYKDDTVGGDTNKDGSGSSPAVNDWGNIYFNSTSRGNLLNQVIVKYASYGIYSNTSYITISNSILFRNYYGIYVNSASPTITGNTLSKNFYGIQCAGNSKPKITNNKFPDNANFSIHIDATSSGATISNNFLSGNYPAIYISGEITSDTIWSSTDTPYTIDGGVTVREWVTLTILPGVNVKFLNGNAWLNVNGTLIADGTDDKKIVFTSYRDDDAGGDTNADGSGSSPAANDWGYISFSSTSRNNFMDHVSVRYASTGVNSNTSSLTVSNSVLSNNGTGILVTSASPTITGNTMSNNTYYGIQCSGSSSPTITSNTFASNANYAIYLDAASSGATISGNTLSGNYPAIYISGGTTSDITWSSNNAPYVIIGSVSVNEGTKLTVLPGINVKFPIPSNWNYPNQLIINGTLIADGTDDKKIVFTSYRDDDAGGDTNGDGSGSSPAANDWSSIYFSSTSKNNLLNRVSIKYASTGVNLYNSSLTVSNSLLSNNGTGISIATASPTIKGNVISNNTSTGISVSSASPTITGNTISNNTYYGIQCSGSSKPTITSNTFSGNANYTIYLDATSSGATISQNTLSGNYPAIYVSGGTTSDITWSSINAPYVVVGNVSVNEGTTLTISPGVIMKFIVSGNYYPGQLVINGTLIANGTDNQKIIFTSYRDDDAGGDTNIDGSGSSPAVNDWSGIYFNSTSKNNLLNQVSIKYASTGANLNNSSLTVSNSLLSNNGTGFSIATASPTIKGNVISNNTYTGISLSSASPTITENTISNNTYYGIQCSGTSKPTIANNTFAGNTSYAIYLDAMSSGATISGNTLSGNYPAIYVSGNTTSDIIWSSTNVPYVIVSGGVSVNEGTTLTMSPDVKVKFLNGSGLTVNGTLNANGTNDQKIVFTSYRDDTAGGDTNGDGSGSSPAANDWGNIYFNSTSKNNLLNRVSIKYATTGVNLNNSSLTVSNSILSSNGTGISIATASPTITGNTLSNNTVYGIQCSGSSKPTIANNTFAGNTSYAIYLDAMSSGATISGNILSGNYPAIYISGSTISDITWSSTNVPYVIVGGISVNEGTTLTISPDVKVKFLNGNGLTVNGTLNANGTDNQKIFFTSYRDDTAGGDTNGDGNGSSPASNDWSGIYFNSTSKNNALNRVSIRYASTGVSANTSSLTASNATLSNNGTGISLSSASPTITGNTISNNTAYGIQCSGSSKPTITSNTFAGNTSYAIYLDATSSGATIGKNTFGGSYPAVYVSGSTTSDITWSSTDVSYVIVGGISVNEGTTLTISPDVKVKFLNGNGLTVNGTLNANGTDNQKIFFTSYKDDTAGGDTNGDGNGSSPAANDWGNIYFNSTSKNNLLNRVSIKYASTGVNLNNSSLTVSNSLLSNNGTGLSLSSASPTITGNTLSNNTVYGIQCSGSSKPTITGNTFAGNTSYAIYLDATSSGAAISGNTLSGNYPAIYVSGGTTSDITWSSTNVPYVIVGGGVSVNEGATLTISPDVKVKFLSGNWLTVNGTLNANGTDNQKIVFTSYRDDTAGGDTNGDGNGSSPAANDWGNIYFNSTSKNNLLNRVSIKYASTGVYLYASSLTVSNSLLSNNGTAIYVVSASPTINNSIIIKNQTAISLSDASAKIINNTIKTNSSYGVFCAGTSKPEIKKNIIADNTNYGMYNNNTQNIIDAMNNTWGDKSGPKDAADDRTYGGFYNINGKGDAVSDGINYYPWTGTTIGLTAKPTELAGIPGNQAINLAWNANTETFLGGYKIYYGTSQGTYGLPVIVNNGTSYKLTGLSNDTKYYVAMSSMNSVGAESEKTDEIVIKPVKDETRPEGQISINSNKDYINSSDVTLNLSASDDVGITGYFVSENPSPPLPSDPKWQSVTFTTLYKADVLYKLSDVDGAKTVYVWYKDGSDNISNTANDSITLDMTAPSIEIKKPTSNPTYSTNTVTINLSGESSDTTSGVSKVTWGNSTGGTGNAEGITNWTTANINLSKGDNTITVTATDKAGNTGSATIMITYNSSPIVKTGPVSDITTNSVILHGTVNASGFSTTVWFEYGIESGSYDNLTDKETVNGTDDLDVNASISNLLLGKKYFYRLVAENEDGKTEGIESTFVPRLFLKFPIATDSPYDTPIIAVLDHYRGTDTSSLNTIIAYTSERGRSIDGKLRLNKDHPDIAGYKNSNHTQFYLTGDRGEITYCPKKDGHPEALWYYDRLSDYEHSGYDFVGTGKTIVAPADGKLYVVKFDKINGPGDTSAPDSETNSAWYKYHTFKIVHQDDEGKDTLATWYLHAAKFVGILDGQVRNIMGGNDVYNGQQILVANTDTDGDGIDDALFIDTVKVNQKIATIGGWGDGSNTTYPQNLHFEVRLNDNLIDPYGWEGDGADPLADNIEEISWQGFKKPKVISAILDANTKILTITGEDFKQQGFRKPKLQVWRKMESINSSGNKNDGTYYLEVTKEITITNVSDTQITATVGQDILDNADAYTVKVKLPHGPRSKAFRITSE